MKQILTLLIPAFLATNAFAQFNITPFLTCLTHDTVAATATAYFGYESFEPAVVTIPTGNNNRFIPDPPNRNQPQLFSPGYFEKAFRVTFPIASSIFWSFNGFAIPVAGGTSLPCPSAVPPPSNLPPAVAALPYSQQLAAIGGQSGITWSPVSGVPAGLTLSPNGLLTGTPQVPGQNNITVQATDGINTTQRQYGLLVGNGLTIDDAISTRAPGFTPQFRLVTNIATVISATAACDVTEFVVTGGGACTVPNSNAVLGRVASSGLALNGWQVTCSGGTATAFAVCSKQ